MTEDFWNSEEISARYKSVKPLGSGGMGSVYLVKDTVLDKLVAIKVLDASLTAQQSIRFQREGKLSAKLNHENIVSVLDFGISEKNVPYLVMEYLAGKDLGALLKEFGPLELEEALQIFIEICDGMIHSHAHGILHRDLKPENVIVSESAEQEVLIKIVDFGIAILKEQEGQLTQSGGNVGSPLYMAPEQSIGKTDERSDIYSIGCLMFATLTGQPPFVGETQLETLMMHKSSEPPVVSEAAEQSFPKEVDQIVSKCLRKNPADRYQSFSDLKEQLVQLESLLRSKIEEERNEDNAAIPSPSPRTVFDGINKTHVAIISCLALFSIALGILLLNPDSSMNSESEDKTARAKESLNDRFEITTASGSIVIRNRSTDTEIGDKDLSLLKHFSKIDKLILSATQVSGIGFKNWNQGQVTTLYMDSAPISYDGLKQICKLPGLETLTLNYVSNLTPACLQLLATDSKISEFAFSDEDLNEQSLKALSGSKTIRHLEIGEMQITEEGIDSVLAIKNLNALKLRKCQLSDRAFQRLENQKKLKGIEFAHEEIDGNKLEKILRLPIASIGFVAVTLDRSLLMKLKGNKRIAELYVTSPGITLKDIESIRASFPEHPNFNISAQSLSGVIGEGESIKQFDPDLTAVKNIAVPLLETPAKPTLDSTELGKQDSTKKPRREPFEIELTDGIVRVYRAPLKHGALTDEDLSALKSIGHPKINNLNLNRSQVTGVGFKQWNRPWVTAIFLDGAPVNYKGLNEIRTVPGLQSLSLREVHSLTPECLHLLATGSNLSTLFFSSEQLTEQALAQLSDSKTISILGIGGMKISESGIERLLAMKNLNELKLGRCPLTDSVFKRLQKPSKLQTIFFLDETIDEIKMDKILKLSIPNLGFYNAILKPSVLKKLKGDPRIKLLMVTSPGITPQERRTVQNSFPKTNDFEIKENDSAAGSAGMDFNFINEFDR